MTARRPGQLRVALLVGDADPDARGAAEELAEVLHGAGHYSAFVSGRDIPVAEAVLNLRGFTEGLTPVPTVLWRLLSGEFDAAHAFRLQDAIAALWWRELTGRPAVFTWTEPVRRSALADRRLRLSLIRRVIRESDAVTAGSEVIRGELERWLAIQVQVVAPADAAGYEALYRGA